MVTRKRSQKIAKSSGTGNFNAKSSAVPTPTTHNGSLMVISIAVLVCVCHWYYLAALHENDLYFSHLSTLERELTFRTEMGFYYSYYKTVISADSLSDGLKSLISDNTTEWPSTINTLQRFNLLPEVVVGVAYRGVSSLLRWTGLSGMECFTISRGHGQPSVLACNGVGDPAYFYVHSVFALNGLLPAALFLLSTMISGSVMGGGVSVLLFLYNHSEATRVMWTPPLRESFAMPLFYLQLIALSRHIRRGSVMSGVLVCVCSVAVMVPWQFSPLALLTQSLTLSVLWALRLLPASRLLTSLSALAVALLVTSLFQFGNVTLIFSFFFTSILAGMVAVCVHELVTRHVPYLLLRSGLGILVVFTLTLGLKLVLNKIVGNTDDAHIASLLLSKLTFYSDFHTQLYLCSREFDFLPLSYIGYTSLTLLLPTAAVVMAIWLWRILRAAVSHGDVTFDPTFSVRAYHVLQCLWFAAMATMIMRLKVFLTPQLAVLCSLVITKVKSGNKALLVALCLLSTVTGLYNIRQQLGLVGEFNNPSQEEMVTWVNTSTNQNAVFAGAMPIMATIKLCTGRPIVNHPHYEHAGLRARTKQVYTVYSHKPPAVVRETLLSLGISHVIVEGAWCHKTYKEGCSFAEVWDVEDPSNRPRPLFCDLVRSGEVDGFRTVFKNNDYIILRVLDH